MKSPSTISLPQGVRDILPEDAEKVARIEAAAISAFKGYGFKRIITPLVEYVDVLSLGMGEELSSRVLKFIDPSTGRVMAIRPDITPQIARLVATKMRDFPLPLKLYYNENVLRYDDEKRNSQEILQIGAEYVSAEASPKIDAEMIVMVIEALKKIGIKDLKIDIGDVGFVRQILEGLPLENNLKKKIMEGISKKDAALLSSLLNGCGGKIRKTDKALLLSLTGFYGEKEVIKKAASLIRNDRLRGSLEYLKKVISIISKKGYKNLITIDLGEIRGFDYYTGVIFEGFSSGIGKPILSGGRYDTLIPRYGHALKACGFAFDIENLLEAL